MCKHMCFLCELSELVLCLCLDLAIGLSHAPPFPTRKGATGIRSPSLQIEAGLRPGDLFFAKFFPNEGRAESRDQFGGVGGWVWVGGRGEQRGVEESGGLLLNCSLPSEGVQT